MARPGPQTLAKRARERAKQEKRKAKEERRALRKAQKTRSSPAKAGTLEPDSITASENPG